MERLKAVKEARLSQRLAIHHTEPHITEHVQQEGIDWAREIAILQSLRERLRKVSQPMSLCRTLMRTLRVFDICASQSREANNEGAEAPRQEHGGKTAELCLEPTFRIDEPIGSPSHKSPSASPQSGANVDLPSLVPSGLPAFA